MRSSEWDRGREGEWNGVGSILWIVKGRRGLKGEEWGHWEREWDCCKI